MYLFTMGAAFAANCSGIVKDIYDEPIIGATIIVKGTSTGTSTDINGEFVISCQANQTLKFEYIGYQTHQYCVSTPGKLINITMCEDFDSDTSPSMCAGAACSSGSGGGEGCTTLPCTACNTTQWTTAGKDGYEMRKTGGTCSGNSCTSNGTCTGQTVEYRCADGYIGKASVNTDNNLVGCVKCSGCCGLVSDAKTQEPIIGATIVIKGRPNYGTSTNVDGVWSLNGQCNVGDVLSVLYLGYVRQDIQLTADNMQNLWVKMNEDLGNVSCPEGYYMDWSTGQSKCILCPKDNNVAGTIAANNDASLSNSITNCYISTGIDITDDTGTYQYTSACHYKE